MTTAEPARRFLLLLLIAATLLVAAVFQPLAGALFTAVVLATVTWPLHQKLLTLLGHRAPLSAGILTAGLVLTLALPAAGLSAVIVKEGLQGARFVSDTLRSEGMSGLVEHLPEQARTLVQRFHDRLRELASKSGDKAAAAVGSAVAATGSFLFQCVMMLIAFYALLVEGPEAVAWLKSTLPLREQQTRELLKDFKRTSYALVVATVVTCSVQALAALTGYLIARVPHPIFFALLTFVIAFIPAIGAASVCEFSALLLLVTGHGYRALFLSLWGFLVVALVDNLVKPLLIKKEIELPGAVVFFSLLGGISAFGAVGLLIGPLATALFITLIRMYRREVAHPPANGDAT